MSEKIYRAMKKAALSSSEPCRFSQMSQVIVEQRGENAVMVATDGRIMARVDFPKTRLRRKTTAPKSYPRWEDESLWPKGGVSTVLDITLLRRLLDVAEAVHPTNPCIRLTVVDKTSAMSVEGDPYKTRPGNPRFVGLIMPVFMEGYKS